MKYYDIVFKGEILLEKDLETVKAGLSRLLKTDPQTVESLFTGEAVVLKRDVDENLAFKFRDAAQTVGAVFDLRPAAGSHGSPPAPRPNSRTRTQPIAVSANTVSCPRCGTPQPRATDCINCGAFLIEGKKRPPSGVSPGNPIPPSSGRKKGISSGKFFRGIRIFILLGLLAMVAGHTYLTRLRTTDWDSPLRVGIYPINGDNSGQTDVYIGTLSELSFEPIARFFAREAGRYDIPLESPVLISVAPEVEKHPPAPPQNGNRLQIMLWSLKFRLWTMRADNMEDFSPDIKMFVVYHSSGNNVTLDNSLGLQKGLVGLVHAFADRRFSDKNCFVVAHEILHTVGATDKYDPQTRQPIFPEGFAEPDRFPRYPQRWAEIMGGRIPESPNQAQMPVGLNYAVIGDQTAAEIRWMESDE